MREKKRLLWISVSLVLTLALLVGLIAVPGSASAAGETAVSSALSVRVSAGTDDAEEEGPDGNNLGHGGMYLDSTDLELTEDMDPAESGTQKIGMRFNGISVPSGANITAAYITFRAVSADSPNTNYGPTNLSIQGQAADNPGTFTSTRWNISNRLLTVATVNWLPSAWSAGTDYSTPDLSAVVQEIVNRGGWASGNSMVFVVTGSGSRSAYSHNGSSTNAPLLLIEYHVMFSGTNRAEQVDSAFCGILPRTYLWGGTHEHLS